MCASLLAAIHRVHKFSYVNKFFNPAKSSSDSSPRLSAADFALMFMSNIVSLVMTVRATIMQVRAAQRGACVLPSEITRVHPTHKLMTPLRFLPHHRTRAARSRLCTGRSSRSSSPT